MDSNILLSKIVANPTEDTWAQVYSTLNLYVVLSVSSTSTTAAGEEAEIPSVKEKGEKAASAKNAGESESIAVQGKELLEKIQREYFSQDEKSLENIKKSIEAATADMSDLSSVSIVLANLTGDILYLILVSESKVILRRRGKVAVVAAGTRGIIEAYSGKVEPDDVILLETEAFSKKISVDKLAETLDHLSVTEIAENLAPLVHNEPLGSEAAIVLQYKKLGEEIPTAAVAPESENLDTNEAPESKEEIDTSSQNKDLTWEEDAEKHDESEADDPITHLADSQISRPKFSLPKILGGDKKKLIIIAIILLAVLFIGGIFFEKSRQETTAQNKVLSEILTPAEKKFDEAVALINLNKGLALDEFNDLKLELEASRGKLPEGTDARNKLEEFISKVNGKIGEIGQGAALAGQKMIYENARQVAFRDGQLITIDSGGKINLLDQNGKSTKEINSKNKSSEALSANENEIYSAGSEGITQSSKDGATKTVVEDPGDIASLDTFGANLYALNTSDKTVDKYPTGSFTKANYFTGDVELANPSSMSIDASIWVLDSGKVRKFTKGAEDDFAVGGLTKDFSDGSILTTGIDYTQVYVLDPANKRIVAISKSGEVKNQYVSKDLAQATSVAVDEEGKKIYVIISGKLYSFDL